MQKPGAVKTVAAAAVLFVLFLGNVPKVVLDMLDVFHGKTRGFEWSPDVFLFERPYLSLKPAFWVLGF